jgi:hypothetical protein
MTTITIKGHMLAYHFNHMDPGHVHWSFMTSHSGKLDDETIAAIPHEFTVEVPELNVIACQVAGLEAAKAKALAAYQAKVFEINERLSKLLAITNETV